MTRTVACTDLGGNPRNIPVEQVILRPAAYAVILNGTRILLLKMRHTGKYHLPGGGIEAGESIHQTLVRETREETGIEIEVGPLTHFEEDFFYYDPSGEAYHGLHFYYRCTPVTYELLQDDRVMDGSAGSPRWVEIQDLHPEQFQAHGAVILEICSSGRSPAR